MLLSLHVAIIMHFANCSIVAHFKEIEEFCASARRDESANTYGAIFSNL